MRTSHVGKSSYAFSFDFLNKTTNTHIVTAEAVYVMVDAHTLSKVIIADELRETLLAGSPGTIVNHAGTND